MMCVVQLVEEVTTVFRSTLMLSLLNKPERADGAVATPMISTRIDPAKHRSPAVLASAVHIIKLERYRED